ncbi:MAG: methylmalonyl-CoA mutase family protein [Kofleriaceae bacterium]|nr:methylmalonyl-CoA mutase family protein [Myxococcales bacterium]MCB9564819.1 methylmalonyl-CoA mutase family protein [Kofleriaceae bacterium]MCB9574177.1 methylmalonyl-CoA mutase family protein [Kofleriaceae bacterium]
MPPVKKDAPDDTRRTMSGIPLEPCYGPGHLEARGWDPATKLGEPGQYPFTRGPHATMYLGKPWTMRMFAGFGTPEDTNRRFKFLLEHGQTGLSTAFDMPTLMGYDPDSPRSLGEVGREGVSVATLDDMRRLFGDIPLDQVSTSMTINAPAAVLLALYVAVAEEQGVPTAKLRGTLQNDMLKEFIAQKEWISPIRAHMRVIRDMLAWCTRQMPQWNTISISGYHIREAGATAVQELAFTLADGIGYVQLGVDAGLDVDDFAPRLSYFWDVHNDFFEEIAKFRAGRRMWATIMRERFGAKNPRSWMLRTHAQTAGVSLMAQQPLNNVVRTTMQALAAVLGGTQSLHTNSYDETYALPTEEAATLALRTQQVIAEETGVANVVDPLAGSYFVETLTDQVEEAAWEYIRKIDAMGGITKAVEEGYPQREIARSAYEFQRQVDAGRRTIVGVNRYVSEGEDAGGEIPTLKIDPETERDQIARLTAFKAARDPAKVATAIAAVRHALEHDDVNVMPPILDAVRAHVTLGEICDQLRTVYGEHRDPAYL